VATVLFTSLFSLAFLGNMQGDDVLLRVSGAHAAPKGTVLGNLTVSESGTLIVAIWLNAKPRTPWDLTLLFEGLQGNLTYVRRIPIEKTGDSNNNVEWDLRLPGTGRYEVRVGSDPPGNYFDSRIFITRPTNLEALAPTFHGAFGLVGLVQYVIARVVLPRPKDSVANPVAVFFEGNGHFWLSAALVSSAFTAAEGIPLSTFVLGVFLFFAILGFGSAIALRFGLLR
jgi:hypothetical protein